MSRILDEDVVLKEIGRWIGYLDEDMIERIKIGIKKLPEAQQWIPCSENTNTDRKLKPCPFCGEYAFTGQFDYPSGHSVWHVYHISDNCYLNGILPDFETEEEAIEAWNRREGEQQ